MTGQRTFHGTPGPHTLNRPLRKAPPVPPVGFDLARFPHYLVRMRSRVDLNFREIELGKARLRVSRVVDRCPICGRSANVVYITHSVPRAGDNVLAMIANADSVEVVYRCPSNECGRIFIALYRKHSASIECVYGLVDLYPWETQDDGLPEEACEVSPEFRAIYRQALKAEAHGLDRIVGMAFRKALEFLVKDYLASIDRESVDKFRGMTLGSCIQKFVDDPKIKIAAERANWLGTDETHWYRKWPDRSVEDLKALIQATAYWVSHNIALERVQVDMPADKKSKG